MHVRPIIGLDGTRRKVGFQAAIVAANTQPSTWINRRVTQVTGRVTGSMQHGTIDQHSSAHASAQREHHHIPPSTSSSPKLFAHESNARIVLSADRKVTDLHHFA